MVRGNWQKRVEKAEARRQQNKEHHQQRRRKQNYKLWVQELLHGLDRAHELLFPPPLPSAQGQQQQQRSIKKKNGTLKFQIWTKDVPLHGPPLLDILDHKQQQLLLLQEEKQGLKSPRIKVAAGGGVGGKKNKGRNIHAEDGEEILSAPPSVGKKKVHPRSKQKHQKQGESNIAATAACALMEKDDDDAAADSAPSLLLCRPHFFSGVCPSCGAFGKNGGDIANRRCKYHHMSSKKSSSAYQTLFTALLGGPVSGISSNATATAAATSSNKEVNTEQLELAEEGLIEFASVGLDGENHLDAMDMLHYFTIEVDLDEERIATTTTGTASEEAVVSSLEARLEEIAVDGEDEEAAPEAQREAAETDAQIIRVEVHHDEDDENDDAENNNDRNVEHPAPNNNLTISISEQISNALAKNGIRMMSLVYFVVNDTLIYDCHRADGAVLFPSEQDLAIVLAGGASKEANVQLNSENDNILTILSQQSKRKQSFDETSARIASQLTSSILEHILSFLPDVAVASTSQVCKLWNSEIGSPILWRSLLERRQWPAPERNEDCRLSFIQHYLAFRDMSAIQSVMRTSSQAMKTRSINDKEVVYQHFPANKCLGVLVLSPSRIMAAFRQDCSLRLFEAVGKSPSSNASTTTPSSSNAGKICRELVCVRVDPFSNTKRKTCTFHAFDFDEKIIGCICEVVVRGSDCNRCFNMVTISQDDFLLGQSSTAAQDNKGLLYDVKKKVLDIGEAVINFLISLDDDAKEDEEGNRMQRFDEFLTKGGDLAKVTVFASPTITACGEGRFLVDVSIILPNDDDSDDDDWMNNPMITGDIIGRKLVLLSASEGSVVWMGQIHESSVVASFGCLALASTRKNCSTIDNQKNANPYQSICDIAIANSGTPAIIMGHLERRSNNVQDLRIVEGSNILKTKIQQEDDSNVVTSVTPKLVITATDVVVAHVLRRGSSYSMLVSFHPRYGKDTEPFSTVTFDGCDSLIGIANFRDSHVVVLGRFTRLQEEQEAQPARVFSDAIIVHIASRTEMGRINLSQDNHTCFMMNISPWNDGTVGVHVPMKGLIMTGNDVRSVADTTPTAHTEEGKSQISKKKKKRQSNKGGKKDGFARGMSLRG